MNSKKLFWIMFTPKGVKAFSYKNYPWSAVARDNGKGWECFAVARGLRQARQMVKDLSI